MPASAVDYGVVRVREALLTMSCVNRVFDSGVIIWQAVNVVSGRVTVWNALQTTSVHISIFLGFKLIHGGPLTKMYNSNTYQIGLLLQGLVFATRVSYYTINTASMEDAILMHRVYILKMVVTMNVFAACSYMPTHVWRLFLFPVFMASWLWWHLQAAYLSVGPVIVLLIIVASAERWRTRLESLSWNNFQMMHELKDAYASLEHALQEVRDAHTSIEQLLSAQQRMLTSLFDASCICNTSGFITQCTQHLEQLLMQSGENERATLTGKHLSSLAASEEDNERLRMFLQQAAAESALHNALTIQASLLIGVPESRSDSVLEVKLFCIRIPSLQAPVSSEILHSEHGGFFIGLQAQHQRDTMQSDSTHVVPMKEAGDVCVDDKASSRVECLDEVQCEVQCAPLTTMCNSIDNHEGADVPKHALPFNTDASVPMRCVSGTVPQPTPTDMESCSSTSLYSTFITLENTFLSVARRKHKPRGKARSEPPDIGDRTFDVAEHVESDQQLSRCDYRDRAKSSSDGDDTLTSSASNMESSGTDIIASLNMSTMLALRATGMPSLGSLLHDENRCVACGFGISHSKQKCKLGFSCNRCHLSHGGLSRSDLHKRNCLNIQAGSLEVDSVSFLRQRYMGDLI
jgi:hypothetical protein